MSVLATSYGLLLLLIYSIVICYILLCLLLLLVGPGVFFMLLCRTDTMSQTSIVTFKLLHNKIVNLAKLFPALLIPNSRLFVSTWSAFFCLMQCLASLQCLFRVVSTLESTLQSLVLSKTIDFEWKFFHVFHFASAKCSSWITKLDDKTIYFYDFLKSTLINSGTTLGRNKLHVG